MTDQVTRIIRRAKRANFPMPFMYQKWNDGKYDGWLLWSVSDHEAYWIHTKTDFVVPSSRNY